MTDIVKFTYADKPVRGDDDRRMLNLTDMWRADGADPSRRPANWLRKEGREFVEFLAKAETMPHGHTLKTPGNPRLRLPPETWGTPKIALAYGMYLSAAFQDHCLGIILSVYSDGFFAMPGREAEAYAALERLIAEQGKQLATQSAHIGLLCERVQSLYSPDGLVKSYQAKMICDAINVLSVRENKDGALSRLVAYRLVDDRLRNRIKPAFPKGKWRALPARRFDEVMSELALMGSEADARDRSIARHAAKIQASSQVPSDFAAERSKRA